MPGTILAVQLGPEQDLGEGVIIAGYRVLLTVRSIQLDVQTTTFYGLNLFQATYSPSSNGQIDIGSLPMEAHFSNFLQQFMNKDATWAQFVDPPYNPSFYVNRTYVLTPPAPEQPASSGCMRLIATGYDPMRMFYLTFKGNFRLVIPIFQDFPDTAIVNRTPDFSIRVK